MFLVLFETANAQQVALFLHHVGTGSTFCADTDLPVTRTAVIMVLNVIEVSGLEQHEFLEFKLLYR